MSADESYDVGFLTVSTRLKCGISRVVWSKVSVISVDNLVHFSSYYIGRSRKLVSQLCNASLKSQSPSEVCRICFEANPKAVWLAWLKCTNTAVHKNMSTVTVVVSREKGSSIQHPIKHEKKLVKVRSLPYQFTEIDQVKLCGSGSNICLESCQRAHSDEELIYWKWQVARNFLFANVSQVLLLKFIHNYICFSIHVYFV